MGTENVRDNRGGMNRYIPEFMPFYEKALPDVPVDCNPVFTDDTQTGFPSDYTGIDSAGNFAELPKTAFHEFVEGIDFCRDDAKTQGQWFPGQTGVAIDDYIDMNLAKCRKEYTDNKQKETQTNRKKHK